MTTKSCRLPEGDGAGQLLACDDPHRRATRRRLHGRVHQGGGHSPALGGGRHAEAAQHEPVGVGVEHDAAHGTVVEDGEQAAAPGEQALDGVEVLAERVGRRVQGGAGTEGLPHDREDVGGRLGTHPAYDDAHSRPCALGEGDEVVELGGDLLVALEQHHVAGALALQQARARDPAVQLAAVPDGGDLVLGAADDRRRHPAEGLEVVEVVEGREGGVEVRDDGERRRVEHRVDELDVSRRVRSVAEGVAVGDHVGDGVAPRAGEVDDPVAAVEGAHGAADEAAAEAERQHREQDPAGVEAAGRGRHEGGTDDRVAEQLGVVLGQGDDAHPAHRVADDDAASGDRVLDDAAQVVAELLDRAVRPRRSGPTGRGCAGRRRPCAPGRGRRRAGSASSRG